MGPTAQLHGWALGQTDSFAHCCNKKLMRAEQKTHFQGRNHSLPASPCVSTCLSPSCEPPPGPHPTTPPARSGAWAACFASDEVSVHRPLGLGAASQRKKNRHTHESV